ncbi:MAG TPA: signal peptide peptidase SppA [Thermoanaerobaculia bacterium]|nr:signal peptide peptidase SppA [Thermoanaerobaculia bacterium]
MSEYGPEQKEQGQGAPAFEEPVASQGTYAPPPPQPTVIVQPRKSRAGMFFFGAFAGCLVLVAGFFFLAILLAAFSGETGGKFTLSTHRVAVVPIEGPILEAREAVDALEEYADSSTVKAIVVRINSPGGAIAPSQEIYSQILRIREETGKPVVASFDSVAASGGFYIASACDQIVANPGSITGSIGVILQWLEYEDLIRWAKMRPETITSGTLKSAGSPLQKLTDEERQYLQNIVNQLHTQFVKAVAEGRKGKLTQADVAKLADGRVFTGEEALGLKLVDSLGTLRDAVRVAGNLAGIEGEPAMIYPKPRRPTLVDILSGSGDAQTMVDKIMGRRAAQFLYLWEAAGAVSVK